MPTTPPISEPHWLDETEARAWRGLRLMENHLARELGRGLTPFDLSIQDYAVLVFLSEHPDRAARPADFIASSGWEKSRVSHQLRRMEARGLVAREACPSDQRSFFVRITDAGLAAIAAAAPAHVADVRTNFVNLLSREQLEVIATAAETIIAHFHERCTAAHE